MSMIDKESYQDARRDLMIEAGSLPFMVGYYLPWDIDDDKPDPIWGQLITDHDGHSTDNLRLRSVKEHLRRRGRPS
jgi:hypothetical protein